MEEGKGTFSEEKEEELDISQLCRVCANTNDYFIPIYEGEGLEHDINDKINRHLPIKVRKSDSLPLQLCFQCASTLIAWHHLATGCAEADQKLRSLLPDKKPDIKKLIKTEPGVTEKIKEKTVAEVVIDKRIQHNLGIVDKEVVVMSSNSDSPLEFFNVKTIDGDESVVLEDGEYFAYFTDEYVENDVEIGNEDMEVTIIEPNKYTCQDCGEEFSIQSLFRAHVKAHKNGYVCEYCEARYKRIDHLNRHIKTMHPDRPQPQVEETKPVVTTTKTYLCKTCGKVVKSLVAYENHVLRHTSDAPFECSLCSEKFPNRGLRRKHEVKDHQLLTKGNGNPDGYHVCEICEMELYSDGAYQHHKYKHGDPFPCNICGKLFASRSLLGIHAKRHSTARPFSCTLCDGNFKSNQELKAHMNVHKDIRPYSCPYCSKTCRKSSDLIIHIRTHTGEKPFICDKCGRGFAQNGDMRKHRLLHFKEAKAKTVHVVGNFKLNGRDDE